MSDNSACDSLHHHILLQRLSASFGLTDKPLEWLLFFLSERTNCIVFGSTRSSWVLAPFGVPQVRCWAQCFMLSKRLVLGFCWRHVGFCTSYMMVMCRPTSITAPIAWWVAVHQMCQAMDALSTWLASNRLLLSASKTQIHLVG